MSNNLSRRQLLSGLVGIAGVGAAVTLAGCARPGKPETVPSDDGVKSVVTVRVVDNEFVPAEVEIGAGQAVRWEFAGRMEHDVVADDGSFVSDLMMDGYYTHLFDTVGEFAYDCSVHPEMTGVVRVVAV